MAIEWGKVKCRCLQFNLSGKNHDKSRKKETEGEGQGKEEEGERQGLS